MPRKMSDSDEVIVQEKLSFVSFNCNGFNNGLSYLPVLLNSFDVIFLQEHWLSVSELEKLNFDGSLLLPYLALMIQYFYEVDHLVAVPFYIAKI